MNFTYQLISTSKDFFVLDHISVVIYECGYMISMLNDLVVLSLDLGLSFTSTPNN